MAQRGRPRKTDSRPNASSDDRTQFRCCRCGKKYPSQRGYFPYNQSSLFDGNNHYCHICAACLDELLEHYTKKLGSETAALRRICSKLDWYYSPAVFETLEKTSVESSLIMLYSSKLALRQNQGKTYDTTMDEEFSDPTEETKSGVSKKMRKFFGDGFSDSDYEFLNAQYNDWISQYECENKAQEEIFKNLSFAQLNILRAQQAGAANKVNDATKSFQDLLKMQNITPAQRKDATVMEQNTLGTMIRKWENERPIMEPLPEWRDPDRIIKLITVYFLGHLCKMIGLKNRYSQMYDQEMEKYRVERPEYEEDEEALFDSVFGGHLDG